MKFREFVLESGTKLLLGKNAESNEELVKKYKGKSNKILHTTIPGSPFCVIDKIVFSEDVYAAGALCARYSQDWRDNKDDVELNVFTGKDVYKSKDMKTGTFGVKKFRTIKVKKEDIIKFEKSLIK